MSLVNKKQLAELFPWSEKSFTAFQKDPSFPIEEKGGRGRENIYDTEKVFAWLLRREMGKSSESPKDRLDRLRGDKEEIVIAKEIEQLVPSEETEIDVGVLNEHSRNILTALSKINKQSECSS